jgi:hypothetical protein
VPVSGSHNFFNISYLGRITADYDQGDTGHRKWSRHLNWKSHIKLIFGDGLKCVDLRTT